MIVLEDMGNILSSRILRGKDEGSGEGEGRPAPDASPLRLVQHDIRKEMAKAYLIYYLPVLLAYNIRQF